MFSRDIFDPQTIGDVAHQMGTVERLKVLTLLTYADISAVNPTAMTPWRAEQLWQLYLKVYNELTRELETERIEAVPAGFARAHRVPARLSRALSAHPLRSRDRRAHGAGREEPQARHGGGRPQAGFRLAADTDRARPAGPVRVGGRNALLLRHEHPEGRGVLQPAQPGAGHVHVRRPGAHAGPEPI